MTDYKDIHKNKVKNKAKEEFFKKTRLHSRNEESAGLVSKALETDSLVTAHSEFDKTFRPDVVVSDPSTFAFYGSAKKYYEDAVYNIINYYPFDGTLEEVNNWYRESSPLEFSLLQTSWPAAVGHVNFTNSQYIKFYAGPQSLATAEYSGSYRGSEPALVLDGQSGNTVEFWMKKSSFDASNDKEVIFDIGTYPGQVASQYSGQFKMYMSASSGSPFYVNYTSGSTGVTNNVIGAGVHTTSSVADGKWHHYALRVYQVGTSLKMEMYVDGKANSTTSSTVTASMGKVDTFMAGTIGGDNGGSDGSLSGSLDEFRFWKGLRTKYQVSRFFDQKIYASDLSNKSYDSRLGVYYKFNKDPIGQDSTDRIIVDYSGNDLVGAVSNYTSDFRVATSAITLSSASSNTETLDPNLERAHFKVATKVNDLVKLGEAYDLNNHSMLSKKVPEWVYDASGEGSSEEDSEVGLLLHLMSTEFDSIKIHLDSILNSSGVRYEQSPNIKTDIYSTATGSTTNDPEYAIGCSDEDVVQEKSPGNQIDFPNLKLLDLGLEIVQVPLTEATIEERVEGIIIPHIRATKPIEESQRAILENIVSAGALLIKRKGTESAFDSVLSSYGTGRNTISYNIYGRNAELFIDDTKVDYVTEEVNSVYFGENLDSTIFLSNTGQNEKTYLESATQESEYTFEGNFIFPEKKDLNHTISNSSVFGLAEVSSTNNTLTFESPNNADFQVTVSKDSLNSDDARFKLSSAGGIISALESTTFKEVYKNSRWNLSVKVEKSADNKFVSSSLGHKIVFSGYNYILDNLQGSFVLSSSLTPAEYESFNTANKTFFIGAQRTNVTGAVLNQTDVKVIDFNAWSDGLSEEELQIRSKAPTVTGRNTSHMYQDRYSTKSKLSDQTLVASLQFSAITTLSGDNDIEILDAASGSSSQTLKYGSLIGTKYPAKSTAFLNNKTNVIQREFLPAVRNIPIGNVHGTQGIEVKTSEIDKFVLAARPESKLFSFEKSMYQSVSREMIKFLSGLRSFNNLLGDPVNKYRKDYKMLNHLREKFYETVENESQFERYVKYFRWLDSSIGGFLNQLIPASSDSNTGIENVVESHALERNKYEHKFPFANERRPTDIGANLLAINELLYDWEHGHFDSDEDNHCLWQRDRDVRTGDRETIRKVKTTVVSGSTYVRRNLVKPYKYTTDRQTLLSVGSNRNANKIKDLYKIVDEGKEITIAAEDIYEFKKCNDVLDPTAEKIYTSKTNTSTTDDYLDADADLILPFTFYSSSAGVDFENFKNNLSITNNHDDVSSLQGPWVRDNVGGMPHRRVKLGTTQHERPEAYILSASATKLTMKQSTGPKSRFHRDLGGARFYHIGNIKTTTSPLVNGNYSRDYEIVMTNGRSLNNNYLVENEGRNLTGGITQGLHIPSVTEFEVPQRTARKHVIVNRFSAPGGAESSAPAGLDRESAEYSVHDTVNYRNSNVRNVLNVLSSEKSERFGFRSGSAIQASIHMTNRNPNRFTGSFVRGFNSDSLYVQHQIPQTDFGYSWVTASANEDVYSFLNKNANHSHQHLFYNSGSVKSSETINFVGSSEQTNNLDFVGLNTLLTRSVSGDTNTLAYSSTTLNDQLLNTHGPFGWPTWKQVRTAQHPIARRHRKDNLISAVFSGRSPFSDSLKSNDFDYKDTVENSNTIITPRTTVNYKEILASSRFNPITVSIHPVATTTAVDLLLEVSALPSDIDLIPQYLMDKLWSNDEFYQNIIVDRSSQDSTITSERSLTSQTTATALSTTPIFSMRATVQNNVTAFANTDMADDFNFKEESFLLHPNLEKINRFISETQTSATSPIRELNYVETIYPREENTYTKNSRTRELFKFFGWNSARASRNLILSGNLNYGSFLVQDTNQKLFPISNVLSAEDDFRKAYFRNIEFVDINSTGSSASVAVSRHITGSRWVLDSRQTFTNRPLNLTSSFFNDGESFLSVRDQGIRGEGILQNDYSIFGLGYNGLRGAPPFSPLYNRRIPQVSGSSEYLAGEAKWTAANGKTGPFYDDYTTYSDEIRRVGQEYSIIPEFTISKFIEDIYESSDLEGAARRDDFLQLTGAIYHSSSGDVSIGSQFFKTYSTTDFMKYFASTQENSKFNNHSLSAARLTLRCQAAIKFLPYRGLYPAERMVQISELFHRGYLKAGTYDAEYIQNSGISEADSQRYLNLRVENSKAQALKPIMAPGVLLNSIKAGLAVDYPIFSSSVEAATNYISVNHATSSIRSYSSLSLGSSTSFTGSIINSTKDAGIPRIKGTVSRRVTFEDMLNPEKLFKEVMYDNEPHPSASLLYGSSVFSRVLERPSKFGFIDQSDAKRDIAINFGLQEDSFYNSMLPYKSAVNNFAAETVKFFLEDEKLQTVVSEPVYPRLESGVSYKMRIYVNNEGTTMYDRHSAFGPPVDDGDVEFTTYSLSSSVYYNVDGAAASASVTFSDSTARPIGDLPTEVTASSLTEINALFDYSPSFVFTAANSEAIAVRYYDTENFVGDHIKLKFGEFYHAATQAVLSSSLQHPRITISGAAGQHKFRFYNSSTTPGTQSDLSDTAYVNVYDVSGGSLRDGSEVAQEFFTKFVSIPAMSQSFAAFLGSGADDTKLNLFGRTRSIDSDIAITSDTSSGSFSHYDLADAKVLVRITTGSNSNGHLTGDYGTEQINFSASAYSKSWIQYFADLNVANTRYINISAAEPISAATVATATRDAILSLSSSVSAYQISASIGTSSNIVIINRLDTGSQGNVEIGQTPENSIFSTDLATPAGSKFSGGASATIAGKKEILTSSVGTVSGSHGFLPYVPPFLDPNTRPYVELSFTPSQSKEYTVPEIIENMSASYYNISPPSNAGTNTNYKESMAISASIDFKKYVKLQSDNTITMAGNVQPLGANASNKYRWVIQPRWETPVLDFTHATASALDLSTDTEVSVTGSPWKSRYQANYYEKLNISNVPYLTSSTGMWHQSGTVISESDRKGYYLTVESTRHDPKSGFGDLATACGFLNRDDRKSEDKPSLDRKSYKLGRLAKKKKISEAVVAIPYYLTTNCEMKLFPVDNNHYIEATELNQTKKNELDVLLAAASTPREYELAKLGYDAWFETPGQDAADNIAYQIRMMDKYIMPPHFDFVNNNNVEPHVAYCFQFKTELTQGDLANIWQNLYPSAPTSAATAQHSKIRINPVDSDVEYVSGYLNTDSIAMLSLRSSNYRDPNKFLEEEVRWLVFKIKMRGESFYKDVSNMSISENIRDIISVNDIDIQSKKDIPGSEPNEKALFSRFGYNWPYDYFSMVELIKIESKVDFYDNRGSTVTGQLQQTSGPTTVPFELVAGGARSSAIQAPEAANSFDSAALAAAMVIREVLKSDDTSLPSPANIYAASTANIRQNTEQLFLNGQLMSHGASNDYTISGNVITLTFDPSSDDSITITYVKG